ncbi:phage minor head protein [Psychrobacter pygoscelis]|uniref:phage head morphogenesis protein n=1 Tax=Psychrobacter pygoscelis TaxID=2488563 RepID=UPI0010401B16|nr:phage minor head protein [Psychrobacter pygoscelis]
MFDVKFIEAIAYALSRDYLLSNEYYNEITAIQRKRTVSIAGLAQIEQVKHVMEQVNKTLDSGETFEQFLKHVESGKIDVNLPRHRLDNIFRTNIQSAYNHGKWQQQQKTKDYRPYLMYDAINDNRTRPEHHALDETVRHIDDPWWQTHYTPNGYRCRCTTRSLTRKQAEKYGITSDEDLPKGGPDSEEWRQSPSQYNDIMDAKVNQKLAEVTLQYFKNKTVGDNLVQAAVKIKSAVTELLESPVVDLSVYIAEAEKLLSEGE